MEKLNKFLDKHRVTILVLVAFCLGLIAGHRYDPIKANQYPAYDLEAEKACVTQAVFHEARGEPVQGWNLVIASVQTRALDPHWKADTLCGVIYQAEQYSFTLHDDELLRQRELQEFEKYKLVEDYVEATWGLMDVGKFNGINHYLRCDVRKTVSHKWWKGMEFLGQVGAHCFYKGY